MMPILTTTAQNGLHQLTPNGIDGGGIRSLGMDAV
jgi:hypothetical protein